MKVLFISDIHGIKTNLEIIKKKMEELECDKIVMLGDLYYIGPKNKIIEGYDIDYVKDFLAGYKDKLICIRGNCDSEIDIEVSDFPIINELSLISVDGTDIYLTHGHIYNEWNWKKKNSILVHGHFHIPFIKEKKDCLIISPGSISLPRDGGNPTYMVLDGNEFTIYDIYDQIVDQIRIK